MSAFPVITVRIQALITQLYNYTPFYYFYRTISREYRHLCIFLTA